MKIFFSTIIILILVISYKASKRPTVLYPLPYQFLKFEYADREMAENSDILIVGDRMAKGLDNLIPSLIRILSEDFSIKIYNWATNHEGIHRTNHKLSTLKKFPPIIIFQGGSEEFFELKYDLEDFNNIVSNLNKYKDPRLLSLIITFPILSKIIYNLENRLAIGPHPMATRKEFSSEKIQKIFELQYQLFQLELTKIKNLASEKTSTLFLLTTPLNLKVPPKEICSNSSSPTLEAEQKIILSMIKDGNTKEAFERVHLLTKNLQGNAQNYYLTGLSLEGMGRLEEAAWILNQGTAFDCFPWRSNIVFNNILRTSTGEKNIFLIDFDQLVNQNFGLNELFQDSLFPKPEYYNYLAEQLAPMIKEIFKR